MASSDKVVPGQSPLDVEATPPSPRYSRLYLLTNIVLRCFLFVLSLVAIVVATNSEQTETIPVVVPGFPEPVFVSAPAKFRYTPAIVYMVVALAVALLYSIITSLCSFSTLFNSKNSLSTKLLPHFVISDILLFGILISATGAAGSIAYTGLFGNKRVGWGKVCYIYEKFCWRVGSSIVLCLIASAVLLLLSLLSVYHMSKKIRK